MSLLRRYKVLLTHNEIEYEVSPLQQDIIIQYIKENGQFFFRHRIKNDITLHGDDFHTFFDIQNGPNRCLPIGVTIKKRFDDSIVFTGETHLNNAKFNQDQCVLTLKIESHDLYSELTRIWNVETNLLDGTTKTPITTQYQTVTGSPSDLEYGQVVQTLSIAFPGTMQFPNTTWPPANEGWVILYDSVEIIDGLVGGGGITAKRTTFFGREFSTTSPPDSTEGGWRPITLGYYRDFPSVLKSSVSELVTFGDAPNEWFYEKFTKEYSWIPKDYPTMANGVTLKRCLEKLLTDTSISVKSNFFDINASGASPSNAAYDNVWYDKVIVFQRSDIKKPNAAQPATKMGATFSTFWAQLQAQYNVIMYLEGSTLVIEHMSFRDDLPDGTDWTIEDPISLKGTNEYDYSGGKYPRQEGFYHEGEGVALSKKFQGQTFARVDVIYDTSAENCAYPFDEAETIVADKTCNDIASIVASPDSFSDNGFVFVATNAQGSDFVVSGANNYLQAPDWLVRLQMWGRPFAYSVNALGFAIQSTIRRKTQSEFAVSLDDPTQFNELYLQKSGLGWGEVDTAEYSFLKCELKLKLKHD